MVILYNKKIVCHEVTTFQIHYYIYISATILISYLNQGGYRHMHHPKTAWWAIVISPSHSHWADVRAPGDTGLLFVSTLQEHSACCDMLFAIIRRR